MYNTSMVDMPEVVMTEILKYSDIRSVFTLRKVCHDLRNYIDDVIPKLNSTSLNITVLTDKIQIDFDIPDKESVQIRYLKNGTGCNVEYEDNRKYLDNVDFVEVFAEDLRIILNHQRNPLERLCFSFKYDHEDDENEFITEVQRQLRGVLESRKSHLSVGKFVMNAYKEDQIMSIIPFLNPTSLNEICILDPTFWGEAIRTLDIEELVKLDQWKSAKNITIRRCVSPSVIQYFGHAETAYLTFREITSGDLRTFQNIFLHSSTLERLRFKFTLFNDESQYFDSLGPVFQIEHNSQQNWFTRIDNSDKIFHIHHIPRIDNIIFSRIHRIQVPQGAVIRD